MDYSKKGIEIKQNYIKSTSRRLTSKVRITLFRLCIVFVVFLVIVGAFAGLGYVNGWWIVHRRLHKLMLFLRDLLQSFMIRKEMRLNI